MSKTNLKKLKYAKKNKVIKPKEIEKNTTIEPQIAPQRVIKENVKNENAMKKTKRKTNI